MKDEIMTDTVRNTIHDYTNQSWGHAISVWNSNDNGIHVTALGHGRGLKKKDYIILANGNSTTRYQIKSIEYYFNPPDMWKAQLKFAPRPRT